MVANSGVLKNSPGKAGHHGWLTRRFWRRDPQYDNPYAGYSLSSYPETQDAAEPGQAAIDLVSIEEQRFIEQKHRELGHM